MESYPSNKGSSSVPMVVVYSKHINNNFNDSSFSLFGVDDGPILMSSKNRAKLIVKTFSSNSTLVTSANQELTTPSSPQAKLYRVLSQHSTQTKPMDSNGFLYFTYASSSSNETFLFTVEISLMTGRIHGFNPFQRRVPRRSHSNYVVLQQCL